jgi:hypothetical protein
MGEAGRAYVQAHFDRTTMVDKMEEAMQAAMDTHRREA